MLPCSLPPWITGAKDLPRYRNKWDFFCSVCVQTAVEELQVDGRGSRRSPEGVREIVMCRNHERIQTFKCMSNDLFHLTEKSL